MKPTLLLLLTSLSALAQSPADLAFQKYDADRDGKVTSEELPQKALFTRFDANGDGFITVEETRQVLGEGDAEAPKEMPADLNQGKKLWQRLDKNQDGKLTKDEVPNAAIFTRFDLNQDGVITQDEGRQVVEKKLKPSPQPETKAPSVPVVTSGPRIVKGTDLGVGRQVPDMSFTDLSGAKHALSEFKATVIAMTSSTCPVSKKYLHSLARLEKELREQKIALILVNPFASEKAEEIQAQLAEAKITATYCHDLEKAFAATLQAQTTTEVFLIDATRTLIYRGALDDQYGVDYSHDAPSTRYLREAVKAMQAGTRPIITATMAPGCELDLPARKLVSTGVTYHRDVTRILQQNCITCHRDQGIAPFALDDLAEVTDRAKVMKRVITEGSMPPWFAAPAAEGQENPWANDCSLSARDKADLLAWLESPERPLGDARDAPSKLVFVEEWGIGQPDYIVQLPRPVSIKADGFMPYQFITAETTLAEDKWVQGYEIVPTDRAVVHHVIVNVHAKGSGKIRDREEGTSGYWAAYVPGNSSQVYPEGFARKLPAGATVSFQIHYTPAGKATQDQLRMGLIFAKEPPRYLVETIALPKRQLNIPPGEANHQEISSRAAPMDLNVLAYMAHMHVRGKAFKYELVRGEKTETLLDIPRYDFNWQLRYDLAQPRFIPRGTEIKITAVFDNSPNNKANPDPTKTVRWGPQTVDEMMIGYIETFRPLSTSGAE
jgi:Ca2+-binding EF-hand superfamily protein/thiol-disulfide isomerase/thioredoxin/mono/diheme cytochrome c family protein